MNHATAPLGRLGIRRLRCGLRLLHGRDDRIVRPPASEEPRRQAFAAVAAGAGEPYFFSQEGHYTE